MDFRKLDSLIDEFKYMIPNISGIFSSLQVHDWKPQLAKAKEIQEGFKCGVQYPTKRERDEAWVRFNDLRTLLFERAKRGKEQIQGGI